MFPGAMVSYPCRCHPKEEKRKGALSGLAALLQPHIRKSSGWRNLGKIAALVALGSEFDNRRRPQTFQRGHLSWVGRRTWRIWSIPRGRESIWPSWLARKKQCWPSTWRTAEHCCSCARHPKFDENRKCCKNSWKFVFTICLTKSAD